jgi:mRNA-degrading endonuclease YafQ of YafQ-DinJ toxin-antitoxin module
MAKTRLTGQFKARFKRRANKRIRRLFAEGLTLFEKNPHDPSLNAHPLQYGLEGYWSFSLTDDDGPDDFRVIYRKTKDGYALLDFGTHDQIYRPWR